MHIWEFDMGAKPDIIIRYSTKGGPKGLFRKQKGDSKQDRQVQGSGDMTQQTAVHKIHIDLPEGAFDAEIELSVETERLVVLAYKVLGISSVVADMSIRAAGRLGMTVSCRKQCAACWRQLVPLSPPEALMIFEFVQTMPGPRKTVITRRFSAALQQLEENGLMAGLSKLQDPKLDQEEDRAISRAYFQQQTACPFLQDESCSIYAVRPTICREYLVASPAENCRSPYEQQIVKLPVSIRLSHALNQIWAGYTGRQSTLVPMMLATKWSETNFEARTLSIKPKPLIKAFLEQVQNSMALVEKEYETKA